MPDYMFGLIMGLIQAVRKSFSRRQASPLHRRRKLFNIGGGGGGGGGGKTQLQYLGGGGGWYFEKYIYACVHMHMYANT